MPRTTLDLDSEVLRDLRRRGTSEGKSMGQVASEMLTKALAASEADPAVSPLRWTSRDLGSPRVDLEDTEAVRALLDERG